MCKLTLTMIHFGRSPVFEGLTRITCLSLFLVYFWGGAYPSMLKVIPGSAWGSHMGCSELNPVGTHCTISHLMSNFILFGSQCQVSMDAPAMSTMHKPHLEPLTSLLCHYWSTYFLCRMANKMGRLFMLFTVVVSQFVGAQTFSEWIKNEQMNKIPPKCFFFCLDYYLPLHSWNNLDLSEVDIAYQMRFKDWHGV